MALSHISPKPLPPPAKDETLPSLPPFDFHESDSSAPLPPPKIVQDLAKDEHLHPPHKPSPIDVKASLAASDLSLGSAPLTPVTPVPGALPQPPPSPSSDGKSKKSNPLTDLIDTEKIYVELLTGIIRKIAGAWSRSNLPPAELDTMFRSIESIYKANRSLLAKLKEIGTNPKGLGDLLIKWIDDLEGPYTNYATRYCSGFDVWEPVQANPRVRSILAMFSSTNPPPLSMSAPAHPSEPPIWTLDDLFLLPKGRLKYYKRLYGRLLKSTSPGRSDHRMLTGALEKLEKLLATIDSRADVRVGGAKQAPLPIETEDEVVIDMRTRQSTLELQPRVPVSTSASPSQRASDSTRASGSLSSSGRRSVDTAPTTDSRTSTSTLSMPIIDLERRLSTERTLDIFTMQPKQVRLQITSPNLHYIRELRCSTSVVISFVPRSTGVEVVKERGHIFLLTDLMLVCEKMTPRDMEVAGRDGPDMWLSYPPLAGKHLRVAPVDDVSLSVTILRKETLVMRTDSKASRDRLMSDFKDCIETASSLFPSSSKNPAPPVPALPSVPSNMMNMSRPPSVSLDRSHPPSMADVQPGRFSASMSPAREMSPNSTGSRQSGDPSTPSSRVNSAGVALADAALAGLNLGPASPHSPSAGPPSQAFPPRSSSTAPRSGGPGSFIPGQIVPGHGFGPGQVMPPQKQLPPSFGSGQTIPPPFGPGMPSPSMGRGPPPVSYVPLGGLSERNPSFGQGMSPGPHPHGPPGPGVMPPSRQTSLTSGPPSHGPLSHGPPSHGPPSHGPHSHGPHSHGPHSVGPAGPPGPGGMPPSRQSSLIGPAQVGPPRVGQSYQGMQPQPRPPQPGVGVGGMPPRLGLSPGDGPGGPPNIHVPQRPPSAPLDGDLRKIPSTYSLGNGQFPQTGPPNGGPRPPMSGPPNDLQPPQPGFFSQRNGSSSSLPNISINTSNVPQTRTILPSEMSLRSMSTLSVNEVEEPDSPTAEEEPPEVPTTSIVAAKMKCKVFLKQQHAQWKALGSAQLMLYRQDPTNVKQLVVDKNKTVLISTIVLTDGVERVGKTGVAIELSDRGLRTGIVYMLQLRNEKSAGGLFEELLVGSDRANGRS